MKDSSGVPCALSGFALAGRPPCRSAGLQGAGCVALFRMAHHAMITLSWREPAQPAVTEMYGAHSLPENLTPLSSVSSASDAARDPFVCAKELEHLLRDHDMEARVSSCLIVASSTTDADSAEQVGQQS